MTLFEAHIFDFDTDIYGETISVSVLRKIRDNRKFESFAELKIQIDRDAADARG
jgi:riboflavin kinase / FMN adenylyltransferase